MKHITKRFSENKLTTFKSKVLNRLLKFSVVLGLILAALEVGIYQNTFISWLIPLSIWLLSGFILTFLTSKYWSKYCFISNFYLQLLCSITSFGSILTFMFMGLNYYPKQENTRIKTYKIISKSSMSGPSRHLSQRSPLVYIGYNGKNKEIVFGYSDTYEVEKADSIVLETYIGQFGFEVISGRALIPKAKK